MKALLAFLLVALVALPSASAMLHCDSACLAKYVNWTSYSQTNLPLLPNQTQQFYVTTTRTGTAVDNQLVNFTILWDVVKNGGLPTADYYFILNSLSEPTIGFDTLNTSNCPLWNSTGVCSQYYELTIQYNGSLDIAGIDLFSEEFIFFNHDAFIQLGIRQYTPSDVISYVENLPQTGSVSAAVEGRQITRYIINLKDMIWTLIVIIFWLVMVMSVLFAFRILITAVFVVYNKVRREFK